MRTRLDVGDIEIALEKLPAAVQEARRLHYRRGTAPRLLPIEALRLLLSFAVNHPMPEGAPVSAPFDPQYGMSITMSYPAAREIFNLAGMEVALNEKLEESKELENVPGQ